MEVSGSGLHPAVDVNWLMITTMTIRVKIIILVSLPPADRRGPPDVITAVRCLTLPLIVCRCVPTVRFAEPVQRNTRNAAGFGLVSSSRPSFRTGERRQFSLSERACCFN